MIVFIREMLHYHGLEHIFRVENILTNAAVWERSNLNTDEELLRIMPYHTGPPHECTSQCPSNMCKGLILDQIRHKYTPQRIVYIGDGSGDFCPCIRLTESDFALARGIESNSEQTFALLPKLRQCEAAGTLRARLSAWCTGHDVVDAFQTIFAADPSLALHTLETR